MAKTKEEIYNDVHQRALAEFNRIQTTMRDSRLQCLQDRRFYSIAGAQWEGPLQDQFANKPRFEANLIQLAIIRIFNEYRNNRIEPQFIPKDGTKNEALADTCNGLYRADQQDSIAEEAHDNGFDEGVGGGFGAWRLRAEYEDEDNPDEERQRIRIEPIFDADKSVFFDMDAKRQDKADAKCCYVLYSLARSAFIDEYQYDPYELLSEDEKRLQKLKNNPPATMPSEIHQVEFDWATPDVIYLAEYYEVERKKFKVFTYQDLGGNTEDYSEEDFENDETRLETLEATGWQLIGEKTQRTRKVRKWIMSGDRMLEDCGIIAGKCIPVVPYYGKRWFVDNIERCMGVTRIPKDMQRLLNMQLSRLGEIAALSTIEKPIFVSEQVIGHQELWANDPIVNNPYVTINSITDPQSGSKIPAGPVGYTKPPAIPPATAAVLEITTTLMRDLLGNQQAAEEVKSNISGLAVELIQNRLDMQAFIYMSNMSKSIKREGEIWLSMAKDLLAVKGRKMKTIDQSGAVSSVTMMEPKYEKGETTFDNDLSNANFDVQVTVGPSSESKRAATVRNLTAMMAITDDPQTKQVLSAMAMMNMDGEGIQDVREFFRQRLIRMGVVKPTEEEAAQVEQEMQNQQPDEQKQFLMAAAKEAEAKATKAQADTVKVLSDADLSRAKTAETYAGINQSEKDQALNAMQTFSNIRVENARATKDAMTP